VDGQTLEPEVQLILRVLEKAGPPPLEELSLAQARATLRAQALTAGGRPVPVGDVRDVVVAGAAGPLAARHYIPAEPAGPQPLLVFFHGGGFVLGDLDSHDRTCRLLCRHVGANVLSVAYRLAPEHRFPAAVDDGRAALAWAMRSAARLGADPARVGVAGDSAGGNIAAVAAWQAARDGGPAPVVQVLVYPATDATVRTRSHELFGEGFLLTRKQIDWFEAAYIAAADRADPRLSVLRAGDLTGVAPAVVVTAGFDPLRDEGEAYAAALRAAGVPVLHRRFPGLIHGFFNALGTSRAAREAAIEVAGAARALFAVSSAG
jgi:acetyl esterase